MMNKIIYVIICLMFINIVSAVNDTSYTSFNRTQEIELMMNATLNKMNQTNETEVDSIDINETKKPFVMPKPTDIKQIFIVVAIVLGVIVIGILIIWRMMFRDKKYMIDEDEVEKPDKKEVQDLIDKI